MRLQVIMKADHLLGIHCILRLFLAKCKNHVQLPQWQNWHYRSQYQTTWETCAVDITIQVRNTVNEVTVLCCDYTMQYIQRHFKLSCILPWLLYTSYKVLFDNSEPVNNEDENLDNKLTRRLYINCVPKKTSSFLFFELLCQKLTDFNNFWRVTS